MVTRDIVMERPTGRSASPQGEDGGLRGRGVAAAPGSEPSTSVAPKPVKVLCVDDDARFRSVIRTMIAEAPGFDQIGEASSGEDAVTVVASLRPDLVLMDVRMPGMDGFEAAARLLESHPRLFVVFMSADPFELPSRLDRFRCSVVFVSKGDLHPERLVSIWKRLKAG